MSVRKERKAQSRKDVVKAATARFRKEGLAGATIADILSDAGLTHGTFYAHFSSKETLQAEALRSAAEQTSDFWVADTASLPKNEVVRLLLARALSKYHVKHPENGCPFVAAGSEAARSAEEFRSVYEESLLAVAEKVAQACGTPEDQANALAIHALCIGGIIMARSVVLEEVSNQILRACRRFAVASHPLSTAAQNVTQESGDRSDGH